MKNNGKLFVVFLTFFAVFLTFFSCSDPAAKSTMVIPNQILDIKVQVAETVSAAAAGLDGSWGDQHDALMQQTGGRAFEGYAELEKKLQDLRIEYGACYVYALFPENYEKSEYFLITVDGSPEPDDWLAPYETQICFTEAWAGTATAADFAWGNEKNGEAPCWSAFAPVHNSQGHVVAILGLDLSVPEVVDFPEWNRDMPEWSDADE